MKNIIRLYENYSRYVNSMKMLPHWDGAIPIHKKLLLSAHQIAKTEVSTAKLLSHTTGSWHPHMLGENPLQVLVNSNLIEGIGSWGSIIGSEPTKCAAMRYTKVRAKKNIEELVMKYVDYVDWVPIEEDPEPVILPTMLPICLIMLKHLDLMGFGFRVVSPTYEISDLINRVLYLVGGKKRKVIPKPKIIGCEILSSDHVCEELLKMGKSVIRARGMYDVDENEKIIKVYGWNPGTSFAVLFKKISEDVGDDCIGYRDETTTSSTHPVIIFEVLKSRNKDEIFKKMKASLDKRLEFTINYTINIWDDFNNKVSQVGVDDLLMHCFKVHKDAMLRYLEDEVNKLDKKLKEIEVILAIRPYISGAIKNEKTEDERVRYLYNKTKIKITEIQNVLSKYTIKILLSAEFDVESIKNNIDKMKNDINNAESVCCNRYFDFLKKYA